MAVVMVNLVVQAQVVTVMVMLQVVQVFNQRNQANQVTTVLEIQAEVILLQVQTLLAVAAVVPVQLVVIVEIQD